MNKILTLTLIAFGSLCLHASEFIDRSFDIKDETIGRISRLLADDYTELAKVLHRLTIPIQRDVEKNEEREEISKSYYSQEKTEKPKGNIAYAEILPRDQLTITVCDLLSTKSIDPDYIFKIDFSKVDFSDGNIKTKVLDFFKTSSFPNLRFLNLENAKSTGYFLNYLHSLPKLNLCSLIRINLENADVTFGNVETIYKIFMNQDNFVRDYSQNRADPCIGLRIDFDSEKKASFSGVLGDFILSFNEGEEKSIYYRSNKKEGRAKFRMFFYPL